MLVSGCRGACGAALVGEAVAAIVGGAVIAGSCGVPPGVGDAARAASALTTGTDTATCGTGAGDA